jgi:hypothetical protein
MPASAAVRNETWHTAEELWEAYELECERRGRQTRRNCFENLEKVYAIHRKRDAIPGDGTISTRQIARDFYPDVGDDIAAWRRKQQSIQRWLHWLVDMGVISKTELRSESGKSLGLRVDLLPVSDQVSRRAGTRGCSSVG